MTMLQKFLRKIKRTGLLTVALIATVYVPVATALSIISFDAGFSPEGSAQQRVIRVLDDAQTSIRLMGYSFTSPTVVKALIAAKQRGVDIKIVVDEKGNHSKASVAAMNLIVNAGIPLRTNSHYPILHDKVIITDNQNLEVGSCNFTQRAARANSENFAVIRNAPALVQTY